MATNKARRELKEMGQVRPELMKLIYSQLSDEEAAERLGDVVRSDPRGAKATLEYVIRTRNHSFEYDTDRAYRVLRGAISGVPPEPVSTEREALFERQRELGWTPLGEAFDRLANAEPELAQLARTIESEPPNNTRLRRVDELIGPHSSQTDPLLRSALAATVTARYLRVLREGSDRDRLQRPVWP